MGAAWYIAVKDLRALSRDRLALFWVLGFPLLFALFLAGVLEAGLGGETAKLSVGLVVKSEAPPVAALRAELERSTRLTLAATSAASAEERVRRGDDVAFVVLEAGAGGTPDLNLPKVHILVDPAHVLDGERVRAEVLLALEKVLSRANEAEASATAPAVGVRPTQSVSVQTLGTANVPRGAADYVFAPAVLWGLIGCSACFAISIVAERARGTLQRLAAAPISRASILFGKALACALACSGVALLISLVMGVALGVSFPAGGKLLLALASSVACFSGITMLLSVLGKTEQSVAGAGWGSLIVLAMLGGGMVPQSFMPPWLSAFGSVSPVSWGIVALEGALWRGFSYVELAPHCALLLGTGCACFALGSLRLRRAFRYA
jgi:ABC-2 type transport system permease protein